MVLPTLLVTMASHDFGDNGGSDWWWVPRLFFLSLWVIFAIVVVRWLVWGRRNERRSSPMDRARGILAERYARGEIDEAEFRQRNEQLR